MMPETGIQIIKTTEVPEAFVYQRSDGLFHVHFKKNVVYDVPLQLRLKALFTELTKGRQSKFIFSAEEGLIYTKEARENTEEVQRNTVISDYALIVNNLAYKIIANFYLRVMKPKGHFRLVSSVAEGAEWLRSRPDQ